MTEDEQQSGGALTEGTQQSTSIRAPAHGQLCYLQIPAADITTSARFYEQTFGWRVAPPQTSFEAPALIGQWVLDRPRSPEAGPVLWLYVEDVRRTLQDAERAGATLYQAPSAHGPRLRASFTDPAGNLIGIFQPRHGSGAPPLTDSGAPQPARAAAPPPTGSGATPPARVSNRTMPPSTVIPQLVYDDVGEAIDWLCDKFGFVERWHVGDHRAQLSLGGGTVVVTEPRTSKALPGRQSVMVRVDDADLHHQRARARGAKIIQEPKDFPYGERQYTAEDLGGHQWSFSQSIADVAPEQWGGTSGPALYPSQLDTAMPDHHPLISVMLIVSDAEAAVAWYTDALGASELWNLGGVAGLQIAGAPFFLHQVNPDNPAEDSPDRLAVTSTRIEVFVDDPDTFIDRAVAAGARAGSPIVDHQAPWGTHRQGGFHDPFGHNWSVGDKSPLRAPSPRGAQPR